MKYSVDTKTPLREIPREVSSIHLVRPLGHNKLGQLLRRCPKLKRITLASSSLSRLSKKSRQLLEARGITLQVSNARGRAISVPPAKIKEIAELHEDYLSIRRIARITGVPKSTVHYLLKRSKRLKLKHQKHVIHLKG